MRAAARDPLRAGGHGSRRPPLRREGRLGISPSDRSTAGCGAASSRRTRLDFRTRQRMSSRSARDGIREREERCRPPAIRPRRERGAPERARSRGETRRRVTSAPRTTERADAAEGCARRTARTVTREEGVIVASPRARRADLPSVATLPHPAVDISRSRREDAMDPLTPRQPRSSRRSRGGRAGRNGSNSRDQRRQLAATNPR